MVGLYLYSHVCSCGTAVLPAGLPCGAGVGVGVRGRRAPSPCHHTVGAQSGWTSNAVCVAT